MPKQEEIKCLKTLQKYWKAIGLFPEKMKDFTPLYSIRNSIIILLTSSPLLIGTLGFAYVAFKGGEYSGVIIAVYSFNFVATVQVCILIFLSRGKRTLKFFIALGSTNYGTPKNFVHNLELIDKATVFLHNTIIVEEVLLALFSHFRHMFCEEKALLKDDRIVCGLVVPFWFPFKIPHANLVLSIYLVLYMPYLARQTCGNILYLAGIVPILQRIEQLKEFLEEIDFEDEVSSHKKLRDCAKYHTEIVQLVDLMNDTVGFIMSPVQNVLIVVMIGILEFQAVNEKNVLAALQLIIWLLVEFLACFFGQLLENASVSIKEMVYNIKWYDMHPSLRNTLKTFHGQVQTTLHYKMQPLIRMNMEYFYKVMKSSYSFLMFLKNY